MSAGPIKAEREARTLPPLSIPNNQRVCRATEQTRGGSSCGRGAGSRVGTATEWAKVTCPECVAAGRADGLIP